MSDVIYPKLANPPLSEVLVDIRLRELLPPSVSNRFQAPTGFPTSKEIKQGQFQLRAEKDRPFKAEVVSEDILGQRYERDDVSEVVQLRRNGVTYSVLKNYKGWDVLRVAAEKTWQDFRTISGPTSISRLAVRYINSINIPIGADYDEYLTTGPRVPKTIPSVVTSFMQRVLVPFEEESATAIITQALEVPSPTVLDIDVFTECSLESSSNEIWPKLDRLRNIADKIFFSSLTEKVINSYR